MGYIWSTYDTNYTHKNASLPIFNAGHVFYMAQVITPHNNQYFIRLTSVACQSSLAQRIRPFIQLC